MIVLNTKDFEELQDESFKELNSIGFNNNPGGIARLFLSVINKRIANLYNALTVNHLRAFLSTSEGEALNAIGVLLNCKRLEDETADEYKYRISQQCLSLATSNDMSIRLAVLSTEGISNIELKPYALGAGTFSVIVTVEQGYNTSEVLQAVEDNVSKTVGYGIKFNVSSPTLNHIKIMIKLYIQENVSDMDAQTIKYDVQMAVSEHINNLRIGEDIMIDQITKTIMNVSNKIVSHQVLEFKINNEKALYVNQSCKWFEMFTLSLDNDNVIIL